MVGEPICFGPVRQSNEDGLGPVGLLEESCKPHNAQCIITGETRLPQSPQRAPAPLPAERKFSVCGTRFLRPVYQSQSTALRSSSALWVPRALPGGSFFFSPEPDLQGAHPCPRSRPGSHRFGQQGALGRSEGGKKRWGICFSGALPARSPQTITSSDSHGFSDVSPSHTTLSFQVSAAAPSPHLAGPEGIREAAADPGATLPCVVSVLRSIFL